MQEDKPVAYTSRRPLTETECRYAQIEKEMLAIVFAAEHFHHYIFGRTVIVQSDHKPLQTIVTKPLHKISPRLQLMMLRLLRYQLTVTYTPGSKMQIADTLSRAYINGQEQSNSNDDMVMRIHSATAQFPGSDQKIIEIRRKTESDAKLKLVMNYVREGWPKIKTQVHETVKVYWSFKDSIHEENGILFYENRIIIPSSMRNEIFDKLHTGHFGLEKTRSKARQSVYWPGLSKDIVSTIMKCATCATFKRNNVKEKLLPYAVPDRPWKKVATDLFEWRNNDYLLVVDYFSKYPEIKRLENKTAECVIRAMKGIFARHGIPEEIVSDNMPFNNYQYREFASEWGFKITTSSPRYPQSNGQSEVYVGIVKQIFNKAYKSGKDPYLAMLEYRNTPISGLLYSPSQLLMSRRLRDIIPTDPKLLKPSVAENAETLLNERQRKSKVR
ncbi:uncharacterized protein K02A2.6-like [Biomphalaria glabrata]|uniref:Uncharacterized protein K02A2.6-like n=1 Tax=Biomphalaria glabrata TaxID=6526 RepID=A0A9W3AUK4_BIOGL|nr:uncharacterized protein K02A2.6-like [Biomphalaria glabrata]